MKFKTMVRLTAVILCMPLSSLAADGWNSYQNYPANYPYFQSGGGYRTPLRSFRPAAHEVNFRPRPQTSRWNENPGHYRFRSWQSENGWQPPSNPRSMGRLSYWGGANPARRTPWDSAYATSRYQPFPMNQGAPVTSNAFPKGQYRFRPIEEAPHPQLLQQPRYLPLQVPIADHYVFRPLNPVARPVPYPRVAYQRPPMPPLMPAWRPQYRLMPDTSTLRSDPRGRYVYGGYPSARPAWRQGWSGSGTPMRGYGQFPATRHVVQRMPVDYRFRPLVGVPVDRPWSGRRVAPMSRRDMPPAPGYLATQYGNYGQRPLPPPRAMGYPPPMRTVYRPEAPPPMPKRYGTDWYDGRGDGEGAWYKLAGVSWPVITQQ